MIMMQGNVLLEFSDYFVEIRIQHRNLYLDLPFRRLFGDRDLDREREKRMNSQKKFVIMLWRSLFEVSDSLSVIVIIVSQIDLKICLVWPAGWPPSTAPSFRWPGMFAKGKCSPYPKHYPLRKPIRHKQLPRESNVKRCHNRHLTEYLSSCEVVVRLETFPAGSFHRETFCISCSFTLSIVDFTWEKSLWRYIRKYITKTIE